MIQAENVEAQQNIAQKQNLISEYKGKQNNEHKLGIIEEDYSGKIEELRERALKHQKLLTEQQNKQLTPCNRYNIMEGYSSSCQEYMYFLDKKLDPQEDNEINEKSSNWDIFKVKNNHDQYISTQESGNKIFA